MTLRSLTFPLSSATPPPVCAAGSSFLARCQGPLFPLLFPPSTLSLDDLIQPCFLLPPLPSSCCLKVPKHATSLNQLIVLLPRRAFSGIPSQRKPSACLHVHPRTSQQGFCVCCSSCFSKSASLHLHIHPKSCLPHALCQPVLCPQLHPSCLSSTNSPCGFLKKLCLFY